MAGFVRRIPGPMDIAMVAHPSVTVLIDLSDRIAYGDRRRGSVVAGLLPGEFEASGTGPAECLQIRLEPVVAAAVLRGSAELCGSLVAFEDVWGSDAERFVDTLRAAHSWDERFAITSYAVARRSGERHPVAREVEHTWRRMVVSRGRTRVDGLADEVGWSRQRLWSRFRSQLGLTPKRAAGLVRFDHAAHLLATGRPAVEVAIESGYADQAHLHRDVRAFSGLTPRDVARAAWLGIDAVAWPSAAQPSRA